MNPSSFLPTRPSALIALVIALSFPVLLAAQVPDTLKHSLRAPDTVFQSNTGLGEGVAIDEAYTVVAVPGVYNGSDSDRDSFGRGAVKVFDTASGALLHVLPNPLLSEDQEFGYDVAISGTRAVVAAIGRVYVFELAGATPTIPSLELKDPGIVSPFSQEYPRRVGISGTRIVAGYSVNTSTITESGTAYVYDLTSANPTAPVATLTNPSPSAGDRFGYSVSISGTRVLVGKPGKEMEANESGSAYVYDMESAVPSSPVMTLLNPTPQAGDNFGVAVAISGTRSVVGAGLDDTKGLDAGIAYVYDLSRAEPTVPVAELSNPSVPMTKRFGSCVAIAGARVVVAGGRPNDPANAGSAYVYDASSATPSLPISQLTSPNAKDDFGFSVAIFGSIVAVGAPGDDVAAPESGAVYVYDLTGPSPTVAAATLRSPTPSAEDYFGDVKISGLHLAVGAGGAGALHLYDLGSTTPTEPMVTLGNPGPAPFAIFGSRIVVGRSLYDFRSATPTVPILGLSQVPPPLALNGSEFGSSVAMSGTHVVVGDRFAGSGTLYVYNQGSATPVVVLRSPSPRFGEYFGRAVAVSGNFVVVGNNLEFEGGDSGPGAARVYVFDLSRADPTIPVLTLSNPNFDGAFESDRFGTAVAISDKRVVVGAYSEREGGKSGSAYFYDLGGLNPAVPVATLTRPDPSTNYYFGSSVAISGTRAVVGAGGNYFQGGNAFVYDLSSSTPGLPIATLNNPRPGGGDFFGAVAIDGTTIAVGAPGDDTVAPDKGAAYVFAPSNPDFDGDGLLDAWEHVRFGTTAGHSALEDSDADGRSELLELAFDTDPTRPDRAADPMVVNEGDYLTITLTKRAGVAYEGQSAGELTDAAFSAATTQVLLNSATTLKLRDNTQIGIAPRRFLRVKVTAAP